MNPVIGSIPGPDSSVADQVMTTLRQRFNIRDEDLVAAELELVPATQPADVGIDGGLIGSWGQDDKLSAYSATRSLFDLKGTPRKTAFAYITNCERHGRWITISRFCIHCAHRCTGKTGNRSRCAQRACSC
jgi:aspartyl aminopeptidase